MPTPSTPPANFPWDRPDSFAAFGAALRARREELSLTLDLLAKTTGISKPYLSNIETARAPGPPSEEKLRLIAAALNLPAEPILTGADWLRAPASIRDALTAAAAPRRDDGTVNLDALVPKRRNRAKATPSASGPVPVDQAISLRPVPLINRVRAGSASEFTDLNYPAGVADQYVPAPDLPDAPAAAFALRVLGDSMAPDYRDGDIIIVGSGDPPPADGADCVVRLGELEQFATTFKRIYFVPGPGGGEAEAVRLVPLNPAHAERTVPLEHVTGIYPLLYHMTPPKSSRPPGEPAPPAPVPPSPAAPPERDPYSFTSRVSLEND